MSAVCPSGHNSETTDYCDQCGAPIAAAPGPLATDDEDDSDTSSSVPREPCPKCGDARSGGERFCEGCGYDFQAPQALWEAVATADRGQFERVAPPGLAFPDDYGERRFALAADAVRIGRGRAGEEAFEIDLRTAPEDPGVSHLHAVLERQADGRYAVRDLGSMNGTTINDAADPVAADRAVPLADGDCLRLGAWTTIVVRKRPAGPDPAV